MQKSKQKREDVITGRWVLFATISAASMAFIGGSALNVALPAIQEDLGANGADLLWIVNSFALLLAALLLVGGSLGDHFGRKRIYMIGIAIFALSSVACGFAPNPDVLIISRAVQGIGGALMVPGSLAIISAYFSSAQRGRAIGTWSSFTTLTSVLGPVLGGFLASIGFWRGVFFINVPLAIAALFALWRYVPESKDEEASKELDYPGAALVTLGLAGFTYGFIELGRLGPNALTENILIPVAILGGVVAIIAFIYVEARSDHPMMPLKLFKSRTFTGTNLLTLFLYGALGGALFFLPLNLVQVQGYTELEAGLALLPFSALLILLSPWAGGLVDKYGPRRPLIFGPIIVGLGFVALAVPGVTNGIEDFWTTYLPSTLLIGAGMGLTVAPLTTSVMGSVPQHNAGIASGVNNAMSRSSQVLATAVLGGVALFFFSLTLNASALDISELSDEQRGALQAEAVNFGNAAVPADLADETAATVQTAINWSFVDTFRFIMLVAAGLCWLSAALAFWLVEPRLIDHDAPQEPADDAAAS